MPKKNEPLKGKAYSIMKPYSARGIFVFLKDDVKLAVEGFIEELEEEKKRIGKMCLTKEKRQYAYGKLSGLEMTIDSIKKWFPDVFEEVRE